MEITLCSRWNIGDGVRIGQSGTVSDYRGVVEDVWWDEGVREFVYLIRWFDDETDLVKLPESGLKNSHMTAEWVATNGFEYAGYRVRRGMPTCA